VIIICDKDSDPPEVPEIASSGDFDEFVRSDMWRLIKHEITHARYFYHPYKAEISIKHKQP
jgi:hypothetical protein